MTRNLRASLPTTRYHDSPQKRGAAERSRFTEDCARVAGDQWGVGVPRFRTNLGGARRSRPAQSLASLAASVPPLLAPPLGPLVSDSVVLRTADQPLAPVWLLIAGVIFFFSLKVPDVISVDAGKRPRRAALLSHCFGWYGCLRGRQYHLVFLKG